jgi:hypothetical protein
MPCLQPAAVSTSLPCKSLPYLHPTTAIFASKLFAVPQPPLSYLLPPNQSPTPFTGHKVEAGTPINVAFYTAARADPRWADATGDLDPARFNPARMLTPEGQKQGWQMPFGFGPRFCVGEARVGGCVWAESGAETREVLGCFWEDEQGQRSWSRKWLCHLPCPALPCPALPCPALPCPAPFLCFTHYRAMPDVHPSPSPPSPLPQATTWPCPR